MKVQSTQKKRQTAVMTVRLVAAGILLALFSFGIVPAVSAAGPWGLQAFPNLKIGFNIRW